MTKELVALVLAGGTGKRFWPLTTNKLLFPFLGKPLISHTVVDILPKEVSRLVLVTNKENNKALDVLHFPVPHSMVIQRNPLGMADAILSTSSKIPNCQLLVIIADDLFDEKLLSEVVARAKKTRPFGIIPGWKSPFYFHGGYLRLDGTRIVGIVEKPGEGKEPSRYVDISGQFFADSNRLLDVLGRTESQDDDVYEQAKSALMQEEVFEMIPYEGNFSSLKYPWNVLDIMDQLLTQVTDHMGKNVEIKQDVVIEGQVWIGDNVKIFENTKIVGPCYIGDNTIIGNNNIIRGSHIGTGCVTGFNTDITRSYVGDNCWFHSNYIGDSVLEGDVSMGSGNVLANLRLDEGEIFSVVRGERINTKRTKLGAIIAKHVRIGVNTSIMPGVKIGAHAMIGAGLMVDHDIPEGSFVAGGIPMVVTKNTRGVGKNRDDFKKKLL